MNRQPFATQIRHRDGHPIIDMAGDLDGSGDDVLEAAISAAENEHRGLIILNFREVGFMTSKGIALLVRELLRAQQNGYRLAAYGLSPHYQEIFDITRLSEHILLFEDEQSALGAQLSV